MAFSQTIFTDRSRLEQHQRKAWLYSHGRIMAPQQITIPELTNRCTQELNHFLNDHYCDSRYGYELFRRALEQHDELAWVAILHVYGNMVTKWVRQHAKFPLIEEEATYFVNRAFERLWRNVGLKRDKFRDFPNLATLLKFLKMCVNAAIIDDGLRLPPSNISVEPLPDHEHHSSGDFKVEINFTEAINSSYFWQLIDSKLTDKKEKMVIYASFLHGMKPREIYGQYSNIFDSVRQVSNIKSNALRRLARIPSFEEALKDFIDDSRAV